MHIAVVGLGYVGLPLAIEFARGGLRVTGIETDPEKAARINAGESYILDVPDASLAPFVASGHLRATTSFEALRDADGVCICVPTPLRKSKDPDISYIVAAVEKIAPHLHQGMTVVLESTTYPGTTEDLVLPMLAKTGLRVGVDYFLAFSPERVDPGNRQYFIRNTPKVVGGITPRCTEMAVAMYRHAVDTLIPVSCARAAEMVKLLENTFRAINIGLANELAIICNHLNVDVWEVVDAAKSKPFGFMPFYPGPGLGGHCIPIDPLYLSWKLKTLNYTARFIELATDVNAGMPEYLVDRIGDALNEDSKSVKGSRICILGVAYKKNVSDTRESPARDIIEMLRRKGAGVAYCDPHVPVLELADDRLTAYDYHRGLEQFDCAVIVTDHAAFDYDAITRGCKLIFDARNALGGRSVHPDCRIVKL